MDGIRVHERDLEAEQAPTGHAVDELRAGGLELVERGEKIRGLERNVVYARPASCEEAADRRIVGRRGDELDATLPDQNRSRLYTLLHERLPVLEPRLEEALVRRDRLVEIRHCDAEVVDTTHAADSTLRPQSRMGSARTVPIVSDECDSGTTSASSASSSDRSSVSFSSSAVATRSSVARCFTRSRFDSS